MDKKPVTMTLQQRWQLQAETREAGGRLAFGWSQPARGGRSVTIDVHFDAEPDAGLRDKLEAAGWPILIDRR